MKQKTPTKAAVKTAKSPKTLKIGAKPIKVDRRVTQGKVRMTPSEAFVETLVAQGAPENSCG